MKKVKVLLLCAFLFFFHLHGNTQTLTIVHSSADSLELFLNYFHASTNDANLRQVIEKIKASYIKGKVTDSLAAQLVYAENLIINLIDDSAIMNRHPFEEKTLFPFGKILVILFQSLPLQKENRFYAAALNNLGILYMNSYFNEHDEIKAFDCFKEALVIRKKISGEANSEYAESLNDLAEMYERKKENEKAISMMLQALAIRKKESGEDNAAYADNLFSLAHLYLIMKKYDTAMLLYEQEIIIRKKIWNEENSRYALYLYRSSDMITYLWQYQKAFEWCTQALAITRQTSGENNLQYAYCLEGLGSYYYNTGEYEKALPYYKQSLTIKENLYGKGYYDNALTFHNLATTYIRMGNYEQAIPCLQQVLDIQKKTSESSHNHAYDLNWQALLYQIIGDYEKALSLYQEAKKIMQDSKEDNPRYATLLINMAASYEALNENEQALSCLQQAGLSTKKISGELSPDYANSLHNLATLYESLKQYNAALILCKQALDIRKNIFGEMHPQYAASLNLLGNIYKQMGKPDSAKIMLNESMLIRKKILGEEHPDYISCLNDAGLLEEATGNYTDAAYTFMKTNQSELNHIKRIYTSLSEHEKIEFENKQYYQFCYLPSLIFTGNITNPEILQQVYANELALKGMVLNDQQSLLNNIRKSNDSSALELYNKWRINKIILGKQLLLPVNERLSYLDSIQEATNQSEQALSRISVAFRQQQKIITAKKISEKLTNGEAAIEFIKFNLYNKKFTDSIIYAAMIILPHDSIPAFIPLFEEKQLMNLLRFSGKNENAINRFYCGAVNSNKQLSNRGDSLYSLIWKPLEKYLAGINTVYYAPAGLLHRIAFAALPFDTSGNLLINKYQLNQVLSTSSVIYNQVIQKPSEINIWGNIQYDEKYSNTPDDQTIQTGTGPDLNMSVSVPHNYDATISQKWYPLYGTRKEMDSIKKIFTNAGIHVSTAADTCATEEAFKALDAKSPQVLHIATHAFFWPAKYKPNNSFIMQQGPMFRSGLVLAGANNIWLKKKEIYSKEDGLLTSFEIAQMDLSNTNLIVLSACETASGDIQGNEGVIGLQRAFKIAGVKQIMISLWRVPDVQTAELMSLFYINWLNGQSTRMALRSAQLSMKAKYPPYEWAGFVLVE